jgi:membrane associated rhomboid family serine protease
MNAIKHSALAQVAILFGCVLLAWTVELVDRVAYGGSLERFGIHPRDLPGLWGILAAPLLHAGWLHVAANTGPFVVLGWLVMLRRISDFVVVTALATLIGGLGVWLFGAPNSIHVGASGLIFGYLGYLLARGYFERSLGAVCSAWPRCSCTAACCGGFSRANPAFRGKATCSASSVASPRRDCSCQPGPARRVTAA